MEQNTLSKETTSCFMPLRTAYGLSVTYADVVFQFNSFSLTTIDTFFTNYTLKQGNYSQYNVELRKYKLTQERRG